MAIEPTQTSKVHPEASQPTGPDRPTGLGQLAKRISAWTTKSLLTVILLVLAIGLGREVVHWWHDDSTNAASEAISAGQLGDGPAPHTLGFGDQPWTIRRQEIVGRRDAALAALQAACRELIPFAEPLVAVPDDSERALLKRLAAERPISEQPGQWQLFQCDEGFPMLVGQRESSLPSAQAAKSAGTKLDEPAYRVVIWGIAVPAAANAWSLYVFQAKAATGLHADSSPEVALPPGSSRLVSLRAADGGGIVAFSSTLGGDELKRYYDRWFMERNWTTQRNWEHSSNAWSGQFAESLKEHRMVADVRLGADLQGRWTGLVLLSALGK